MPTFDNDSTRQWMSWKPDNLLAADEEKPLPTLDTHQSEEQLKAELSRLQKQAEQRGFDQGLSRGAEEGRKQGFEAGLAEGREAGLTQGIAQAQAQQQEVLRQAENWINNFKLAMENLDSLIPGRLVQLSLTAVQQLYGSISMADNTALLKQIRHLMKHDTLLHGNIQLYVNPQERANVAAALGDTLAQMGWELHSDSQLVQGGCRIASAEAEFDASLEMRWQTLCQLAQEDLKQ